MTMLQKSLLCVALAMTGTALAVPMADQAQKDRIVTGNQEPDKNKPTAASGDGDDQPIAASSDKANSNPSVSSPRTKHKKKDKNRAKPSPSKQEEEFNKVLQGIHG